MENKFLKIKEWKRKQGVYYYAERLGIDSVAFILHDRYTNRFGLINEYKPPIDQFLLTAFGGSLDNPELKPIEIVEQEVREEAGYVDAVIKYVGLSFVSTQMNQFCYLYLVDVTGARIVSRAPQNSIEEMSTIKWVTNGDIINGEDWKAITILTKAGLI